MTKLGIIILTLISLSGAAGPVLLTVPEQPPTFSLAIGGDVLLAGTVGERIKIHGVNYPWGDVAPFLQQADLAIVNLETSVAEGGKPQEKTFTFRSRPETLEGLKAAGVDMVALANNHVLDYGREGLEETLSYLARYEIQHAGAGLNEKSAYAPAIKEINGAKIAFLSFSMVVPPGWQVGNDHPGVAVAYGLEKMLRAVKNAKDATDFVLVYMHWGIERQSTPSNIQQEIGRELVNAGADLVIGSHPHVLQGIEFYRGVPIFYSLGNFVFTNRGLQTTEDTILLLIEADKNGVASLRAVPFEIIKNKPTIVGGKDQERIFNRLIKLSSPLGTEVTLDGEIFPIANVP